MRINQEEILGLDDPVDVVGLIHKSMSLMNDASVLLQHEGRPLERKKIRELRRQQQDKTEIDTMKRYQRMRINDIERLTQFDSDELYRLHEQYLLLDPYLQYSLVGVDLEIFSRVLSAVIPLWTPSIAMQKHLFKYCDQDHDNTVNFQELAVALSHIFYGSFEQSQKLAFSIFDEDQDGYLKEDNLVEMLHSIYSSLFLDPTHDTNDETFNEEIRFYAKTMTQAATKEGSRGITLKDFSEVVAMQPIIMLRMKNSHPHALFDIKDTFYWVFFDTERERNKHFPINLLSPKKEEKKKGLGALISSSVRMPSRPPPPTNKPMRRAVSEESVSTSKTNTHLQDFGIILC